MKSPLAHWNDCIMDSAKKSLMDINFDDGYGFSPSERRIIKNIITQLGKIVISRLEGN